ncbi:MAG: hypothetical protein Q4A30_01745 [Candidatus Saccharibacteria bacterium]|nr:hypothetical protein [Candidatus Saccharibacteria bacterium]
MQYHDQEERGRKIKILTVAIVSAVIVLAVGAWAIIATINSVNHSTQPKIDASQQSKDKTTDKKKSDKDKTAKVDNSTKKDTNKSTEPTTSPATQYLPSEQSQDIPSTGPEDLLPTAILIGLAVYLVLLNRNLKQTARARQQA